MSTTNFDEALANHEQALAPTAEAAAPGGWFDCNAIWAGPAEEGSMFIRLRERGGAWERWYRGFETYKKEMLAVALTAITTGFPVSALLTTSDEYGTINRLYVRRP